MKRLAFAAVVCCVLVLSGTTAWAGQWFVGGSIGQASVETSPFEIDPDIDSDFFKGDDTGYKLYGGYAAGRFATIELGAFDLGTISDTVFGFDATSEVYGAGLAVTGVLPVAKIANLYGKLGYAWWDVDASVTDGSVTLPFDDSGTDIFWGLGVRFNLGSFGIRGEFEVFELEDADEVSLVSLGVDYRF